MFWNILKKTGLLIGDLSNLNKQPKIKLKLKTMITSKHLFIDILDNGFVLKEGNSKRAIETTETVEEFMIRQFKGMISNLSKVATNNIIVSITVDENVPIASSR